MKTVGIREIRDMNYIDDQPNHCQVCTRKFDGLAKQIDKLQQRYIRQLDNLVKKAKTDMGKMIAELVAEE
jgi:hypothetical protein